MIDTVLVLAEWITDDTCNYLFCNCIPEWATTTRLEWTKLEGTRQVSSMIHSARPTDPPAVNIVFAWNLFCFARFWEVETYLRTDNMCKNNDHYRPWLWVGRVDQKIKLIKFWVNFQAGNCQLLFLTNCSSTKHINFLFPISISSCSNQRGWC